LGDSVVFKQGSGADAAQGVFFLFIHYSHATYQIMARLCTVRFLSAVRAVAARCKLSSALRPGLSQEEVVRTKEITKERRASENDKGKNKGLLKKMWVAGNKFLYSQQG